MLGKSQFEQAWTLMLHLEHLQGKECHLYKRLGEMSF